MPEIEGKGSALAYEFAGDQSLPDPAKATQIMAGYGL